MDFIYVEFYDPEFEDGWGNPDNVSYEETKQRAVGLLLEEKSTHIKLAAATKLHDFDPKEKFGCLFPMVIPEGCIIWKLVCPLEELIRLLSGRVCKWRIEKKHWN